MTAQPFVASLHFVAGLIVPLALATAVDAQAPSAAVPTSNDIDAQYAAVLRVMKKPPAGGVLVTEIGPGSPAGAAGLRAGDIITKLAGEDVRDLGSLRQRVADLIAAANESTGQVALVVRREAPAAGREPAGTETRTLQIAREPLGIRAIEVQAGVPARLNPPPSVRGTITLGWKELRQLQNAGGDLGQTNWFRTQDSQETWLGWQSRTVEPAAEDVLSGKVEVARIEQQEKGQVIAATETIAFRLRTGDFAATPAFILDSVDVLAIAGGSSTTTAARRAGGVIRMATEIRSPSRIEGPFKTQHACPMTAIIPAALPLVAAAMPQQKDAVLAIHLMSARDFVARPGYVLVTCGKQPLPRQEDLLGSTAPTTQAAPQAWKVDLMHCGIVVESYWLNDQRRLIRTDIISGTSLTSQRVPTETEARVPVYQKSVR